jgi:FMN phosphatase YigB (HAD superfamily)
MNITTLIFDFDGVMSGYDVSVRLTALSQLTGIPVADITERLWASGLEEQADGGRFGDGDSYLAAFNEALGAPVSRQQWIDTRSVAMTHWPDMHHLVDAISGHYATALLSNNGPLTHDAFADLAPHTARLFADNAFFSYQFGTKKPDPAIFAAIADRLAASPQHCVFIDDKVKNVDGARQAGMTAFQFRGLDMLRAELARLNIAGVSS